MLDATREAALRERGERFDYLAWDLYAEVTRCLRGGPRDAAPCASSVARRRWSRRQRATAELADHVAQRMVRHHLRTMHRIGVRYDLFPRESDILALRFWETAFARLRELGRDPPGRRGAPRGCWVMQLPRTERGRGEDEKVIVRTNGTVTYVGKDIAYQMWKFGLLGRDFRYARFAWSPDAASCTRCG